MEDLDTAVLQTRTHKQALLFKIYSAHHKHTHTKRSNIYLMGFLQLSNFQSCAVPLITHQQKQHSIPKSKPQKKTLFVEKQKLRDDER